MNILGEKAMDRTDVPKKGSSYRWLVWGIMAVAYLVVFFHRLAAGVVRMIWSLPNIHNLC